MTTRTTTDFKKSATVFVLAGPFVPLMRALPRCLSDGVEGLETHLKTGDASTGGAWCLAHCR